MTATVRQNTIVLLSRRLTTLAPDAPTGLEAIEAILDAVTGAMHAHGYRDPDLSAVRVALWEATLNAVKHGHRRMPGPRLTVEWDLDDEIGFAMRLKWADSWETARVWWEVGDAGVLILVSDSGRGFDPDRVPDPTELENLETPGGRGLLMMQRSMTRVCYNSCGNAVTLWKARSHRRWPIRLRSC